MRRLDQHDAYRTEFEAWLEGVESDAHATWWRLDASAFYPTSGGQLHDTGDLTATEGSWRVTDVTIRDGAVWHRVEAPDAGAGRPAERVTVGAALRGRIDWPRRFRHMQRHTAQHLLSQAFLRLDEAYGTRSVGLSSPEATLDLAGEPGDDAIRAAEALVNEVASRALRVRAFEIDEEDLPRYPLRRPPTVRGRIRIVEIGDWERSACGGTHLRSTAEALPILVEGSERIRGGLTRVTFRAGLEAVGRASVTGRAARAAAARLSSGVDDLEERVALLQEEAAAARRLVAATRADLAETLAASLAAEAPPGACVAHRLAPERAGLETPLADALARRGLTAAIGAADRGEARLVLVSGAGRDVRPALRAALEAIGGRGGGRAERAQGAGPGVEHLDAALEAARMRLEAHPDTSET
jgi:alanyl-tRNA synthetase